MTSNYQDGNQCYIETANIDGETNLKVRESPVGLKMLATQSEGLPARDMFNGHIEFEQPNKNIHNFIGALHLKSLENPVSLSADNILLRGALFSNTEWAYCIVIYTGQETKIQMNNKLAESKMSKIEQYANTAVKMIFLGQVTVTSIAVGSIYFSYYENLLRAPYIYYKNDSGSILPLWLESWFVFFLLFNNFIPISLYVTLELVNLGQSYLISSDQEIYEESLDSPCLVRTSSLLQELGQVSNVFSDKTGTLTRNEMVFVKYVINHELYDVKPDTESNQEVMEMMRKNKGGDRAKQILEFFRCLTVCHTVVRGKNGQYRSESPDELALVEGAGNFDCSLLERGASSMDVKLFGTNDSFDILAVNAFNADRKRMSILVKQQSTGKYILMCKGADNIMLELCRMEPNARSRIEKSLYDLGNTHFRV